VKVAAATAAVVTAAVAVAGLTDLTGPIVRTVPTGPIPA
jgi:hypothetical protein